MNPDRDATRPEGDTNGRQRVNGPSEHGGDASPGISEETYRGFRAIAAEYLRRERADHTLQPTALVNEAYVRLGRMSGFADRQHFVASFARAMRNILVDHARARNALKRGGPVTIRVAGGQQAEPKADGPNADPVDLIELDDALDRLERLDERQARVVELRFFGGLGVRETAGLLGVSDRTVESDWRVARAWLQRELRGDARGDGSGEPEP